MHTEAATGIMAVAGITATAGIMGGTAGDVAGTLTGGGGVPWGGRTTTGALGATRITGATPLIIMEDTEDIILTRRIITAVTVPIITID